MDNNNNGKSFAEQMEIHKKQAELLEQIFENTIEHYLTEAKRAKTEKPTK